MLSHVAIAALLALLVSRCQRGREFRDLCFASFVFCVCVFACCFIWFVSVRPKFQSYGVRHMLPYPYHIFIFVSSHLVSHELHAYYVIYPAILYLA